MSHSGTPRGSGSPGNPGPMDIDTDDCSSPNWTPATQGSAGQAAFTGTQPLVAVATIPGQTRVPASHNWQGSQATFQNSDPCQRAGSTGGVSTQAMKPPPVVSVVSSSGNTAMSSSTSTSASTMESQSSMALPSTGMDMQWTDPTAQNDPLSPGLPQMWADDLYVMQPLQFVPMGQQVYATAPVQASQPFVQQPAASASAPGQQAQDAVMMASAMWQMILSMVQQQQRMGSVPGGPGTPRMGCPPAAVTPVLPPRIPGINAMPRFPAPSQMTNVPIRTPLTPPMVRSTPQTGTQGYVHLQHQDVQPSQRTPDCDPSPVDHRPSVFTLDPPRLQRLPSTTSTRLCRLQT